LNGEALSSKVAPFDETIVVIASKPDRGLEAYRDDREVREKGCREP